MDLNEIAGCRLFNQGLFSSEFRSAKEVVARMGAIQAQDSPMSKWAIGIRQKGSSQELVASALDEGQIVRTHVLRPTWHIVSSEDIHWMLELTAPQIKSAMHSNDSKLELTEVTFRKSNAWRREVKKSKVNLYYTLFNNTVSKS